jgi:hypothetical protein
MNGQEIDAGMLIFFWGCFQFYKYLSGYLERLSLLALSNLTVPKYEGFPQE